MPNGTEVAVQQAAKVSEIGFPEFTAKLVTDVFDALVAANIRQTESYMELIEQVAKTLTVYINDTRDDISGAEILQFLAAILPSEDGEQPSKIAVGETITGEDVTELNAQVRVEDLPAEADADLTADNQISLPDDADTDLTQAHVDSILTAVANRLAANKYTLLQQMVEQGILRLVVENGVIETRLTFNTFGSSFYQSHATQYNRSTYVNRSKGSTGFLTSLFGNYASSTKRTSLAVTTANQTNRDISGSRVQIYGRVQINFKTDYQPLGT